MKQEKQPDRGQLADERRRSTTSEKRSVPAHLDRKVDILFPRQRTLVQGSQLLEFNADPCRTKYFSALH